MRLKLNPGSWEVVRGGGIEIELLLVPLSFLDKIRAGELFAEEEHVIESTRTVDERGRPREMRVTRVVPGAQRTSRGLMFVIQRVVRSWRNVENETGEPVPFSHESLDSVMGQYPEWANALAARCCQIAGVEPGAEASDPQKASASSPGN